MLRRGLPDLRFPCSCLVTAKSLRHEQRAAAMSSVIMSKTVRPPVDSEPITVRLPRDMLRMLDEFRRSQEDLPTRPEAIRRILLASFSAKG